MDLYNIKQIISNATFYNTATEKKIYFESCITKAIKHYNKNKNNIEQYAVKTLTVGNDKIGYKTINLDNTPRPKITHKQAFETKYNDFIKAIKKEISNLSETIELETDLLKCNNINNSKEKYFCLIRLKNSYTSYIENNKLFFEKEQPQYHKQTVKLYSHFLKQINKQLKKIKKTKPEQKPTNPKVKTLKPNFDDFNGQIETIHKETQPLFISTLTQWKQLFSNDIPVFNKPIELKQKTTISDLVLFFSELKRLDLIKNGRFNKYFEIKKVFLYNGNIINAKQLKNAKQKSNYPNTLNSNIIHNIFTVLKLD